MTTPLWLVLALAEPHGPTIELPPPFVAPPTITRSGKRYKLDADIPARPPLDLRASPQPQPDRDLGTPITLFVNFDGVTLGDCNPSNSKNDCHWYYQGIEFPPFSGSLQTKVSVLQAMRRMSSDLGVRVTGVRPSDDENYAMIVYGGTEEEFGALGSAPSGDCYDQNPNEIGFAHLDGELAEWINGGATTALHEAGHTWGLDHIDVETGIMYPEGDNIPTGFRQECDQIVEGVELDPIVGSCPDINEDLCGDGSHQVERTTLQMNFGAPYVDSTAPTVSLAEPEDGQYFQVPATFDVVFDIEDDLHPQVYEMRAWLDDEAPPDQATPAVAPGFAIRDLPIGSYTVHVAIADEAGNETTIEFSIEVGEDPPPVEEEGDGEGCACRSGGVSDRAPLVLGLVLPLMAVRRRRR